MPHTHGALPRLIIFIVRYVCMIAGGPMSMEVYPVDAIASDTALSGRVVWVDSIGYWSALVTLQRQMSRQIRAIHWATSVKLMRLNTSTLFAEKEHVQHNYRHTGDNSRLCFLLARSTTACCATVISFVGDHDVCVPLHLHFAWLSYADQRWRGSPDISTVS